MYNKKQQHCIHLAEPLIQSYLQLVQGFPNNVSGLNVFIYKKTIIQLHQLRRRETRDFFVVVAYEQQK